VKRFSLTRHFSLVSFIFILLAGLWLSWLMRDLAVNQVKSAAEDGNVYATNVFRNALGPDLRELLRLAPEASASEALGHKAFQQLRDNAATLMADTNFVKIKVYDNSGITRFSTERGQVGEDYSANAGFRTARDGVVASVLTLRRKIDAFEGTRSEVDVVSSHVPLHDHGRVIGVVEVYQDVSALHARVMGALHIYVVWLVAGLSLLYLLLFVSVRRMDQRLRAKDVELLAANQTLEQGVAERTRELSLRTGELQDALAEVAANRLKALAGQEALSRLVRSPAFRGDDLAAILNSVIEEVAATLDVRQVTLWQGSIDPASITCIAAADEALTPGILGTVLGAGAYPRYFSALAAGEVIVADDALSHPATSEFAEAYLRPSGIGAMLDVPVHVRGRIWGVACIEHVGAARRWTPQDIAFATGAAALLALALEGDERRAAERRLRELSARMQLTLDTAPAGIYMVDATQRIVFHSRQANLISGLPGDVNWVGRPLRDFLLELARLGVYGEGDHDALVDARLNGFLLADPEAMLVSDITVADGSRVLRVTRTPHAAEGFVVVSIDVTAERRALDELRAAKRAAEAANLAKSEFLSSMSHELRTPMNAILGFAQLMELDTELVDEHQDSLKEIMRAGDHLLGLINQVLDLAKIESGHLHLSVEPVAVDPLVAECFALVHTLAARRSIEMRYRGQAREVVAADQTRLKQALLNLLSNAIKYNREGGRIDVELQDVQGGMLRILVTDTGRGIPADRLPELFQPFNRLSAENSEIEGTGIGLNITRRLVELMGGAVDASSVEGVGSHFWIDLARAEPQPQIDDGAAAAKAGMAMPHTVLYIEDNPANIRLLAQVMSRRGDIHLLTAHTPELGLELAFTRTPDLVLLDINLPGLDGYDVLAALRADERTRSIPVVALTANVLPRDIERGLAAGFDDYLTKPIDLQLLARVLETHLVAKASIK
jgi:signal transduction histidine kinase/ActR/RegA family two-component response regulator